MNFLLNYAMEVWEIALAKVSDLLDLAQSLIPINNTTWPNGKDFYKMESCFSYDLYSINLYYIIYIFIYLLFVFN